MNAQTSTGDTALTYACENGHTEVADLLLKYGAELEHESEGGRTPLMKAARAGHLSTVSFLLKRGAEVNRATANNDHTPLSLACAGGHQGVVEVLLQHGADPFHKLKVRIANVQGWAKVRIPGSVSMTRKSCVVLPAAGRRMQLFHLIFTEPGNRTLAHPCTPCGGHLDT